MKQFFNRSLAKIWPFLVVLVGLGTLSLFALGAALGRMSWEKKLTLFFFYAVAAVCFAPIFSETLMGPVYAALPEYAPTQSEIMTAAAAEVVILLIGILALSFHDVMPGTWSLAGFEIPKRFVYALAILFGTAWFVDTTGVRNGDPFRRMMHIFYEADLTEEQQAKIDESLLNAWQPYAGKETFR